ncbi:hypothetical protein V6N12_064789 [Hibiscus sabdariffa]|uniref:Uncharacterized protein n=1 Tax=Hibiscus sabdariffa TaxID=183260 RepID=A0ABR2G6V2_9ROSI
MSSLEALRHGLENNNGETMAQSRSNDVVWVNFIALRSSIEGRVQSLKLNFGKKMKGSERKREGNSIVLLLCWFYFRNDEWKKEYEKNGKVLHMQRAAMDDQDEEEGGE